MGLLWLFACGAAALWVGVVLHTWRSLTRPPRRTLAWRLARGQPADPGALSPPRAFDALDRAGDARGHPSAWIIRGDDLGGPTVVFCHGWGESRHAVLARLDALAPHAASIIAWDLPGHGDARPGPCPLGALEHERLHDLLDAVGGKAPIVLYGFSLGAGVCIRVGAEDSRVGAVIAEAPYRLPWTPARNVMEQMGMPHRLTLRPALSLAGAARSNPLWRGFDRASWAGRLACPLLIVHGELDRMCPTADASAIVDAAPDGRLVVVPRAGHLDMWTDPHSRAIATDAMARFFRSLRGEGAER